MLKQNKLYSVIIFFLFLTNFLAAQADRDLHFGKINLNLGPMWKVCDELVQPGQKIFSDQELFDIALEVWTPMKNPSDLNRSIENNESFYKLRNDLLAHCDEFK